MEAVAVDGLHLDNRSSPPAWISGHLGNDLILGSRSVNTISRRGRQRLYPRRRGMIPVYGDTGQMWAWGSGNDILELFGEFQGLGLRLWRRSLPLLWAGMSPTVGRAASPAQRRRPGAARTECNVYHRRRLACRRRESDQTATCDRAGWCGNRCARRIGRLRSSGRWIIYSETVAGADKHKASTESASDAIHLIDDATRRAAFCHLNC